MSLSNTLFLRVVIEIFYTRCVWGCPLGGGHDRLMVGNDKNVKTPIGDDGRDTMSLYALIRRLDCARRCMP